MFVQHLSRRNRCFTNFHYCYYYKQACTSDSEQVELSELWLRHTRCTHLSVLAWRVITGTQQSTTVSFSTSSGSYCGFFNFPSQKLPLSTSPKGIPKRVKLKGKLQENKCMCVMWCMCVYECTRERERESVCARVLQTHLCLRSPLSLYIHRFKTNKGWWWGKPHEKQ